MPDLDPRIGCADGFSHCHAINPHSGKGTFARIVLIILQPAPTIATSSAHGLLRAAPFPTTKG
jgi:hypothetical protein